MQIDHENNAKFDNRSRGKNHEKLTRLNENRGQLRVLNFFTRLQKNITKFVRFSCENVKSFSSGIGKNKKQKSVSFPNKLHGQFQKLYVPTPEITKIAIFKYAI